MLYETELPLVQGILCLSKRSAFGFCGLLLGAESKQTEIGKRLDAAASVLREIMTNPDEAIPGQVLKEAKCIVVVPSIVKVALGIGARHCDPFIEKEACSAGASAVISKSKAVAALIATARSIFDEIAA